MLNLFQIFACFRAFLADESGAFTIATLENLSGSGGGFKTFNYSCISIKNLVFIWFRTP